MATSRTALVIRIQLCEPFPHPICGLVTSLSLIKIAGMAGRHVFAIPTQEVI